MLRGVFSAITRKPLKVRRQVKHCWKVFREIFHMKATKKDVCRRGFGETFTFLFLLPILGRGLDISIKNISSLCFTFFNQFFAFDCLKNYN